MSVRAQIVLGFALLAVGFWTGHMVSAWLFPPPRIVTVELNKLIHPFVARTAKSGGSETERKDRTVAFAKRLQDKLDDLAARRNLVILPANAVVAGAPDVTGAVLERLGP